MRTPRLVSVVIPVRDAEAHLGDQLDALAEQTYGGEWEVVVADNGCRDGTVRVATAPRAGLPAVTVADARARRGINHARNAGAATARGDFLAFCDADDTAAPGWLAALVDAGRHADLVGGRNEWERLNDPVVRAWRPSPPMTELMRDHAFLPYAPGGNLGVWADVARSVGWDERYVFGGSDQAFAWHAQLAGHRLAFAPDAVMHLRFRSTIRATARQYYGYGRSAALLHRAFRAHGIPPADNRAALRRWRRLLTEAPAPWSSRERRGGWARHAAFSCGRLAGSVRGRALVL